MKFKIYIIFLSIVLILPISTVSAATYDDAMEKISQGDFSSGIKILNSLAISGDVYSQYFLALMYRDGYGVTKNTQQALKWFKLAADKGFSDAQLELGLMYSNGDHLMKNSLEAIHFFRQAADLGNAKAQYMLGVMYTRGDGVPEDSQEAIRWIRLAAESGYDRAQLFLGLTYAVGEKVPKDSKEAARWYQLAADQGFADAQFYLGLKYSKGDGVVKDDEMAYFWMLLASSQGYEDAERNRDLIGQSITSEQRIATQAKARAWKPKKVEEKITYSVQSNKNSKLLDEYIDSGNKRFDFRRARKDGYSDKKIANFLELKEIEKFKFSEAREAGYSDKEIIDYLITKDALKHNDFKDFSKISLKIKTTKTGKKIAQINGAWKDIDAEAEDNGKKAFLIGGTWFIDESTLNATSKATVKLNQTDRSEKDKAPASNNPTESDSDERPVYIHELEVMGKNPNKLPSCPKPDVSMAEDNGKMGRTKKWNACWGKYLIKFDKRLEGSVFEGEWKNGVMHGVGTLKNLREDYNYLGDFESGVQHGYGTFWQEKGHSVYRGQYKDGVWHGYGNLKANGFSYDGEFKNGKFHGKGTQIFENLKQKYMGDFHEGFRHGQGTYTTVLGSHTGGFRNGERHGNGAFVAADGSKTEGVWENNKLVHENKKIAQDFKQNQSSEKTELLNTKKIILQISHTQPSDDGNFSITVHTITDVASLRVNDKEEGSSQGGHYNLNLIAKVGQPTTINILATDIFGNSDAKVITVSRAIVESKTAYATLRPAQIKKNIFRDAIAIVIGISDYKSLPKAEFANDDARIFYDYAVRALGVKPDNIKLLVDSDADELEIIKTFKTWLPSRVKSTTDVYFFYSGHGLPTQDGQGLYLLPPRADRDFISRTAIQFQEINADIQAAKPKSVTIFIDACYSGQARSGEALIANARPVTLKTEKKLFPDHFTVITASQNDQISSSSPDLKHGIFSYYLMKGMEGDADVNKDGKITLGEMQTYLVENVGRQAGMMSRKQEPQLIGDVNRVLVGQ
ncbi:MORN motif [Oxalobacteraceae bacterium]